MAFQPLTEKQAERQLIRDLATKIGATIVKLQEDDDDGKTDGIIEYNGKQYNVEARCKGYPNHRGYVCSFKDGWKTNFLANGIFLNELTLKNHKNCDFIY